MKTKAHILFDKTKSSLKILFALKKIFKSVQIHQAIFFIVIGDLLLTMKKIMEDVFLSY